MTEDENTTPSSSGATAALSQNTPIVMPESFTALNSQKWDLWLAHFEDCVKINSWNPAWRAQFSCGPYVGESSAPVAEYSGVLACKA